MQIAPNSTSVSGFICGAGLRYGMREAKVARLAGWYSGKSVVGVLQGFGVNMGWLSAMLVIVSVRDGEDLGTASTP